MAGPILMVGIAPAKALPMPSIPGLTPEVIASQLVAERTKLADAGCPPTQLFLELDDTDEPRLVKLLKENDFKAVLVGAGLRMPPPHLELFEKVINIIHANAPNAKIAFNTAPDTTYAAVKRVLPGLP